MIASGALAFALHTMRSVARIGEHVSRITMQVAVLTEWQAAKNKESDRFQGWLDAMNVTLGIVAKGVSRIEGQLDGQSHAKVQT